MAHFKKYWGEDLRDRVVALVQEKVQPCIFLL